MMMYMEKEMSNKWPNESGIYFCRENREGGNIKIGLAEDLNKRRTSLQIGNSSELILVAWIACNPEQLLFTEQTAHRHFETFHVMGEWFNITVEQAEEYISKYRQEISKIKEHEDRTITKIFNLENTEAVNVKNFRPRCFFNPEKSAHLMNTSGTNEKYRTVLMKDGTRQYISDDMMKKIRQLEHWNVKEKSVSTLF